MINRQTYYTNRCEASNFFAAVFNFLSYGGARLARMTPRRAPLETRGELDHEDASVPLRTESAKNDQTRHTCSVHHSLRIFC